MGDIRTAPFSGMRYDAAAAADAAAEAADSSESSDTSTELHYLHSFGEELDSYGFFVDLNYEFINFTGYEEYLDDLMLTEEIEASIGILYELTPAPYTFDANNTVYERYYTYTVMDPDITTWIQDETTSLYTYGISYNTDESTALVNKFGDGGLGSDASSETTGYLEELYTTIAADVYGSYISQRQLLKRAPMQKMFANQYSSISALPIRYSSTTGSVWVGSSPRTTPGY